MTQQNNHTRSLLPAQKTTSELSQVDLETVQGGTPKGALQRLRRTNSAPGLLESAPFHDSRPGTPSSHYSDSNVSQGSLNAFMSGHDFVEPVLLTPPASPPH